jgi:teichuronic acid exporter
MSLRKQATSGLIWTFGQQFGSQLISFVISIVLARLLDPSEFGLIGMIAIFMAVGKTLMDSGMTSSLLRTKNPDQNDYSTVFLYNLFISLIIYIVIYFMAPYVAIFYEKPILTNIIRVYCVTFLIQAFSAVQRCRFTKNFNFKIQLIIDIPSNILSGVIGIIMAYMGYGVWSLVFSGISGFIISTIQVWFYSDWRPTMMFDREKFKQHFNFGYKLTISSLLNKIFENIYVVAIGKLYTPAMVGYYTRANTMQQLPVNNLSSALNKVTYPLFSNLQDDDLRLKNVYRQLMQSVIFVISPVLILLFTLAEPVFRFLLTEKWLPAVPYFQILCLAGLLRPINSYNLNILKVKGRSELYLYIAIAVQIIIFIVLAISIQFGIMVVLYGQVFVSIIAFFIYSHYAGRMINYTAFEQLKNISPILMLGTITGITIHILDIYILREYIDIIRILIGGLGGVLCYLLIALIFKFEALQILLKLRKGKTLS